jgi:hypothetical protein
MHDATILMTLALAAVVGGAEDIGPPPPPTQPPKVVCPQPAFDWGTVFTAQEVTHTYALRNEGGAELQITSVQESCKCTAVEYPKTIPPGGAGGITLKVETKDFQGPTVKQVTVFTNDPAAPKFLLQFGGLVRDVVRLAPRFPALRGVIGGEQATTQFVVEKATDVPVDAFTLSAPVPSLTVKIEEAVKGSQYKVLLTTVPGLKAPNTAETVVFSATAGGVTVPVAVKVNITLTPRIFASPQWVIIRSRETEEWEKNPAQPLVRTLKVLGAAGLAFKVEKVATEGDFFDAEVAETVAGKEYAVTLKVTKRPGGNVQPARGKLLVYTNDPVEKKIEVGVMAFFNVK